uniref:Cathepsin L 1 n=1 Tax=Pheronema raphanus TaxID=667001 RepID=C8CBC9_9METZ|nr:cathepsin L 1 [Pheronema raphanus]
MSFLIASYCILAITFACEDRLDKSLDTDWKIWKATHKKVYYTLIEENFRRLIWEDNLSTFNEMNSRGLSYTLGTNEFADMTSKEFVEIMNGYKPELRIDKLEDVNEVKNYSSIKLSDSVDWRSKGAVTPVKNQGQCGSCWAFSSTGSLEGQYFINNDKLLSFSESELVDCSRRYGNNGCKGGLMDNAFRYWEVYKEELESDYPYVAKDGPCRYSQDKGVTTISSYKNVPHFSQISLQDAVRTIGPISVAMDASHKSFQLYHSGVYSESECSQTKLDHGVLVVGYGTSSEPFWLVKNSWGAGWGMDGYFEIAMRNNMCGLETEPSYPIL